ncbi:A-kinase anchor protein 7-like isoform X1 [Nerophis lumbriciformis]|uniref:A-kinase anchor protein 7-like isoform X1 n=1 Tax=Nerophis lumbriciformis TaxID=546530 RepID=UPI002ADF94DD|nr:A-kinase anchor protein 7-like isoform X1 [Nerophis lumbriciformis]
MHLSRLLFGLLSTCCRTAHKQLAVNVQSIWFPYRHTRPEACLSLVSLNKMASVSISHDRQPSADDNNNNDEKKEEGNGGSKDETGLERGSEESQCQVNTVFTDTGAANKTITKRESRKKKRKRAGSGGRVDSEEDAETKKKKKPSQRPNYFVSIPITNSQISTAVSQVQEALLEQEPRLAKAMIPVPTLHITLLVTHLADQEQVDLAAAVLAQVEPLLAELLAGVDLVLPFSGVTHFRNEVVFVDLTPGLHRHILHSLADLLRGRFEELGLLEGDRRGFEPHLTIMKLSKAPKLRSKGIKRVDPALYSNYTSRFFGNQKVERLDLCSMLKRKQEDGYYHTETSLQLGGRRRSELDEAELLRISKRLVDDAVNRALQQYKQETLQNGGGPNVPAEGTITKTDDTDARK